MAAKHIQASISPPRRVQILKADTVSGYWKPGQFGYAVAYSTHPGMYTMDKGPSESGELSYLVSKSKGKGGGALWFSAQALRFTGRESASTATRSSSERSTRSAHAAKRDRAADLIENYGKWESRYSNEDLDRAQGLAIRLTDIDREEGRDAPPVGFSAKRFAQAKQVVSDANLYGEKQQKLRASGRTHARKRKLDHHEAKRLLEAEGIDFTKDVDATVSSMSKGNRIAEVARQAGYRKRKDAPGSTARMYFQYLSRLRDHATRAPQRRKHTVYDLVEVNKRTKKQRVLHEHFSTREHAKEAAEEYRARKRPDVTYRVRSRQVSAPAYRWNPED